MRLHSLLILGLLNLSLFANNDYDLFQKDKLKKEKIQNEKKEDLGIPICTKENVEKNKDCVENSKFSMDNYGEEFENENTEKEDKNDK